MTMDNRDLVSIIKAHREDSLGVEDGDLSNQRARALDHYHGRPYGNEVTGRSQVVSRDLAEAVDWAMPAIMRVFIQSGNLGEFDPIGPDDEELAQQESDYVNQVLMRDNPGFLVLHDAIKDTLLLKNGYVKHFWDETEEVSEEDYTGLTMGQVAKMLQDLEAEGAEVEIKGQSSKMVPIPGMPEQNEAQAIMQPMSIELFDIKLQIKRYCGKLVLMAVPTEEVRVSKRCRGSLQDSPFTEHVTKKTRSDLIEMGLPRDFVDELPAFNEHRGNDQELSRDSVTDEAEELGRAIIDRSMDEIEFCEAYIRVDADGDGIAELRKIVTCGDRIPPGEQWNEVIEAVPMTGFVMKRVPHRHVGESLDDILADIQEIKTVLHRQLLDNVYLTNSSQYAINERVNVRDMMTSTPGGIKRILGKEPIGDSIAPLPTVPIVDKILPVIAYWDDARKSRSGIDPGIDMNPDILREVTKGAYMEQLNRLSQLIEMISRMLAETGVKEMFLQAHGILMRHQDQPRMVQMRGEWINVNPLEWKKRTDLTVKVGLGTGNEEEKRQKLGMLSQMQGQLLQAAVAAPKAVYSKMYALFADMTKSMGFDVPDKYAISPEGEEYQQLQAEKQQQGGPPDPRMAKVMADAQAKQQQMTMQQETDRNRQEMEARQQEAKRQGEMQLAQFEAMLNRQMEQERMRNDTNLQIMLAHINNAAKLDAAQIAANTTLTAAQESASDAAVGDVQ